MCIRDRIFSAQMVEHGKPAPDVFLLAAEKMGYKPSECLVIEDSVPGVKAAKAAGMTVYGFTGGAHMSDVMVDRLKSEKPDSVFSQMDELLNLISEESV